MTIPPAPKLSNVLRELAAYLDATDTPTPDKHAGRRLAEAHRLARDWASPLSASGGDGSHGKGDHADPTVTTALARPDETMHYQRRLEEAVIGCLTSCGEVYNLVHRITHIPDQVRRDKSIAPCSNLHGCPDDRFSDGDRGRCSTCANFLRKHGRDRKTSNDRGAA